MPFFLGAVFSGVLSIFLRSAHTGPQKGRFPCRIWDILPVAARGAFVAEGAREKILSEGRDKLKQLSELAAELRHAGVTQDDIIAAVTENLSGGSEQ